MRDTRVFMKPPEKATMALIGRRLKLGNKVFPGDKYSAGEGARPVFYLED